MKRPSPLCILLLLALALPTPAEEHPPGPVKKEVFDWGDPTQPQGATPKGTPVKRTPGRATPGKPPAEQPAVAPATPDPAIAPKTLPETPSPAAAEEHVVAPKNPEPTKSPEGSGPASKDEPGLFAATFFGHLQKGHVDDAYASLTKGSKISERPEELKALKTKTNEAIQMFGVFQGFDLVETKSVGSHILRRTYLSLGKEFPLRWRFYFYKAESRWRLVDLRVDDRLTGIFDEPDEPRDDSTSAK